MIKKVLAAAVIFAVSAPAEELPTLSDFLLSCYRDNAACRVKLKDYVTAANAQKSICLPKGVSINEGAGAILSWLKADDTPAALKAAPYDDALYEASTKLYPCAPPEPAPPAPAEQPAAPQL